MFSIASTQLMYMALWTVAFLFLKQFLLSALKSFYLHSVARLGDVSIRWILEHDELDEIGLQCRWHQPVLSTIFLLLFSATPLLTENWAELFLSSCFLLQLFLIAWVDAATGYIPNFLTYFFILSGVLLHLDGRFSSVLLFQLLGIICAYFFLWIANACSKKIWRHQQIGEGDMLFLAGISAWLGTEPAFKALFVGNMVALVASLFSGEKRLRYAPYLALGAVAMAYGPFIGLPFPSSFFLNDARGVLGKYH